MKYAVIAISGSQHKIEEKQTLTVDKIDLEEGKTITTDQVLLLVDGENVEVGTPTVKDASVEYKIINHHQGDKLKVFKYKNKTRYRKTMGFRAQLTEIEILKINNK